MNNKSVLLMLIAASLITFYVISRVFPGADPVATFPTDSGGKNQASADGSKKAEPERMVTLRVAAYGQDARLTSLNELASRYEEDHRNVTIIVQAVQEEKAYASYASEAWNAESPDLILLNNAWVREFAAKGWLSGRAGEVAAPDLSSRLTPAVTKELSWNGYMWALPLTVDPYVLVCNREDFQGANLALPMTAADLQDAVQHFAEEKEARIGLYMSPEDPLALISAAWSLGAGTLDGIGGQEGSPKDGGPANNAKSSSPPAANTGDKKTASEEDANYRPPGVTLDAAEAWQRLKEGSIAMMIVRASDYMAHAGELTEAVPLPLAASTPSVLRGAGWLDGLSIAVSAQSAHIPESLEFAKWLSAPSGQSALAESDLAAPADRWANSLLTDRRSADLIVLSQAVERSGIFEPGPDMASRIAEAGRKGRQWWNDALSAQDWLHAVADLQRSMSDAKDEADAAGQEASATDSSSTATDSASG